MQLYDAIASLVVTRLKTEGPSPVDHELYSQLSYEHMLSSRYALHNAPPHGREWSLDRSAALLLSRMDVEGAMSVSELAEALDLDISTIHRQVAAAMKSGSSNASRILTVVKHGNTAPQKRAWTSSGKNSGVATTCHVR